MLPSLLSGGSIGIGSGGVSKIFKFYIKSKTRKSQASFQIILSYERLA